MQEERNDSQPNPQPESSETPEVTTVAAIDPASPSVIDEEMEQDAPPPRKQLTVDAILNIDDEDDPAQLGLPALPDEVSPETALQLHNIVPRVIGNLRVDVLSPKDKGLPDPNDSTKLKYEDPRPVHGDLKTIEPLDKSSGSSSGL